MSSNINARRVITSLLVVGLAAVGAADAAGKSTGLQFKSAVKIRVQITAAEHLGRVHVFVNEYSDYRNGFASKTVEVPIETIKLTSDGGHTLTMPVTDAVRKASMHGSRKGRRPGLADFYMIGDFGQSSCVLQRSAWVLKRKAADRGNGSPVRFGSCQKVG